MNEKAENHDKRTVESEVIMCKNCIHRPIIDDPRTTDGFSLQFPDFKCPCRCDDPYYSWMPNDNWFCGNGETESERKKGKWIVTSEFGDCRYAKCNQCKVTQVFYYNKPLTNFCPNCGADMRGENK